MKAEILLGSWAWLAYRRSPNYFGGMIGSSVRE
jgi:hypothetical protein